MTDNPWDNLPKLLELNGGYLSTDVRQLLSFAQAQAAGARIIAGIESELAARNIGHFPTRIPRERNHSVLLYNQGEPLWGVNRPNFGYVLHAVRQLTEGQTSPAAQCAETPNQQVAMVGALLGRYQKWFEQSQKQDTPPA